MRTSYVLNSMHTVVLILGCFCSSVYTMDIEKDEAMKRIVSADNNLGFNVFKNIVKDDIDKNILISPASLAVALNMTYNGANGKTREAMAEVLKLGNMSLEEINEANAALLKKLSNLGADALMVIANSLWARMGEEFRGDFLRQNEEFYDAHIRTLDFDATEAPSVINTWVEEKTGGKIEGVVEDIPKGTILYLINAAYFKGAWGVKFDKKYTQEKDFTLMNGGKKKVSTMMTGGEGFKYLKGDKFDGVGLPYGYGKVWMYAFIPSRESNIREFYDILNEKNWNDWMKKIQGEEITIVMPKFSLEYEISLSDCLTNLGMGVAFGKDADFGRMFSYGGVWIDEIKQKTFLKVDEEGTEVSASTTVIMKKGPMGVYLNRPFFYAIRDEETGAILFMGSIVEP